MKENEKTKQKKSRMRKSGKGIETLYRITMNNHVQFNKIADNKANILISVNAIIISIVLTTLLPSFLKGDFLILVIPTSILLVVCLLTLILSILATAPKASTAFVDLGDSNNPNSKLLFFGNFHEMELNDFTESMKVFQSGDPVVYDALNENFYLLGKVLANKYKYLHISYRIFMFGFFISVFAFCLCLVIAN